MAKYVDVEKVFCAICEDKDRCGSPDLFCDVHSMPAEDVVPVVHGEWRWAEDGHCKCTVCGQYATVKRVVIKTNFCPNCGADMRERKGEDA